MTIVMQANGMWVSITKDAPKLPITCIRLNYNTSVEENRVTIHKYVFL